MLHAAPHTLGFAFGTGLLAAAVFMLSQAMWGNMSIPHALAALAAAVLSGGGVLACRVGGQARDAALLRNTALHGTTPGQGALAAPLPDAGALPPALGEAARAIADLRDAALRDAAAGQALLGALDEAVPYLMLDTRGMATCASPVLLALLGYEDSPALPAPLDALGLRTTPDDSRGEELLRAACQGQATSGELVVPARCASRPPATGAAHAQPPCLLHLALVARPITDTSGRRHGSFVLLRDMTPLRAAQCGLAETTARSERFVTAAGNAADEVTRAAEALATLIQEANAGAASQQERTAETATAMEQMNATVMEVARNASQAADQATETRRRSLEGARQVDALVAQIGSAEQVIGQLAERVGALDAQAGNIGSVMSVISDIADQTNLLALNAAIEAARAGDAGRGFAVVADEVRKLAEKTMNATREVSDAITGIQQSSRAAAREMDGARSAVGDAACKARDSGQALSEILSLTENTSSQVQSIATAAEQQSATSAEINRAVEAITGIAGRTMSMMNHAAQDIFSLAGRSNDLSRTVAGMSEGTADGGQEGGKRVPCWEFKKCGREKGGAREREMGVCPAWPDNGQSCANVAGTFCGGQVQETFAKKIGNCARCDYFKSPHYQRDTPAPARSAAPLRPLDARR